MASVAVVLAIVFAGICVTEYQRTATDVDEALTSSIDRAVQAAQRESTPFGMIAAHSERMLEEIESLFGGDDGGPGAGSDAGTGLGGPGIGAGGDGGDGDDGAGDATGGVSGAETGATGSGSGYAAGEGAGADGATGSAGGAGGTGGAEGSGDGVPTKGGAVGPRIGGRDDEPRATMPVAVYTLSSECTLNVASRFTTAIIDDDVLQTAAGRMGELDDGSGTLGDLGLHYQKRTVGTTTYVAFADTSTTDSWQGLALTLAIAGMATLAVFFVIALLLSKWALAPVKEAWESQRQFVADASHDLKTPLTVILANASILLKHPDHSIASESQWVESTQVEAEHMQGLVNEMLELAQVEAGQQVQGAPHEPIDFSDLVDGETLLFDSVALERNCQFDCTIEQGLHVLGNEQQLHKMVSTLVENAFKYVDAGGSIGIALRRAGKTATLAVRNTGSTISEADLPHIFDRFYRTDKARTSGEGGFGLGLAIAREIARQHGGDISCASDEATGTTFTVTLPVIS